MEGHAEFIKMAQKNKKTETTKPGEEASSHEHRYGAVPKVNDETAAETEAEAVAMGPTDGDDINKEQKEPTKIKYRYTIEEMKSYNPYRRRN